MERTSKFEKSVVLARLEENMKNHRAKVEEAWVNYRAALIKEMEAQLEQAKAGRPVQPNFLQRFPIPQDYTDEYERVIDRLQTQMDSTVEMTNEEFNQWMRDEWQWLGAFAASSGNYIR